MREKITTSKAPAASGLTPNLIRLNDFLFASGQIPVDPETGEVVGDTIESQAAQVMKNVQAILEAAGMTTDDVVKTTCLPLRTCRTSRRSTRSMAKPSLAPGPLLRRRARNAQRRFCVKWNG